MKWIRKALKDFWDYIVFLVVPDHNARVDNLVKQIKEDAPIILKTEGRVVIAENPNTFPVGMNLVFEYIEGVEEAKIISISLWNEGRRCEHTYKRVDTSKEHRDSMKASGTHKDYICSKCGHAFCATISDDAKALTTEWNSILSEQKGE